MISGARTRFRLANYSWGTCPREAAAAGGMNSSRTMTAISELLWAIDTPVALACRRNLRDSADDSTSHSTTHRMNCGDKRNRRVAGTSCWDFGSKIGNQACQICGGKRKLLSKYVQNKS